MRCHMRSWLFGGTSRMVSMQQVRSIAGGHTDDHNSPSSGSAGGQCSPYEPIGMMRCDGRVPLQRPGREMHPDVVEFG